MGPEFQAKMVALRAEMEIDIIDQTRSLYQAMIMRRGGTYTDEDHALRISTATQRARELRAQANALSTGEYP